MTCDHLYNFGLPILKCFHKFPNTDLNLLHTFTVQEPSGLIVGYHYAQNPLVIIPDISVCAPSFYICGVAGYF